MGTIFVRERRDIVEGDAHPRYSVVGAQGSDIKFFKTHVRKAEIEAIAMSTGAEIVYLPSGSGEHGRHPSGEGQHRGRRRRGSGSSAPAS
jgi:hypothetical protein